MYNNPFAFGYPYTTGAATNIARPAIGRGLLGGIRNINWGGLLTNTQKTLNVINQAIPIVYQVKPIVNNAKTMFKIANTLKDDDNNGVAESIQDKNQQANNQIEDGKPIFFI